jgi:hypothetical protein
MTWKAQGPHAVVNENGYVVARYRIAGVEYFRPSHGKSFIGPPVHDKDQAKRVCADHHKEAQKCPVQS